MKIQLLFEAVSKKRYEEMKLFVGPAKGTFPRMAYVTNVSLMDVCHVVRMVHFYWYWSLVCSSPTVGKL
jgi:hypothetical protein